MKRLAPFFSYYGSKWRMAPMYPAPKHDEIIEPFAGSAQYATLHHTKRVVLLDKNPIIVGVWQYLIRVSETELRALPLDFDDIRDVPGLPQEARWFVGFWLNSAVAAPRHRPSKWTKFNAGKKLACSWGETCRERVASQLRYIRHWQVAEADWLPFQSLGQTRGTIDNDGNRRVVKELVYTCER